MYFFFFERLENFFISRILALSLFQNSQWTMWKALFSLHCCQQSSCSWFPGLQVTFCFVNNKSFANTRVWDIGDYEIATVTLKDQSIYGSHLYNKIRFGTVLEGISVSYHIFENLSLFTFKHFWKLPKTSCI